METNTTLTLLLIIVSVIGTILIPVAIGLISLYSRITKIEASQTADHNTVLGLGNIMDNQAKELNERKTDIALIQQDIGYIKDSVLNLTTKIDTFINRIDEEITIHHSCANYIEAKKAMKK